MSALTIRGLSDETIGVLRRDAGGAGRSLTRHVAALLDDQADRCRRREELRRLTERLATNREGLAYASVDSGALLWAERGGR